MATGNTYIEQSDIRVPGLGGGIELRRTWNSLGSGYGLFGEYWSSNFDEHISVGNDHLIKQTKGSGAVWSYGWNAYTSDNSGSVYLAAGPRNDQSTLQTGLTTWTLTLKNGDKKVFDLNTGVLLSIVDRNGNTTQLSYDANNRLTSVVDPAGRHLYFGYVQITVGGILVNVVNSVTSDFGISLTYQYDSFARLIKVTRPDNSFVSFEYSAGDLITAVKDSAGKVLESHTYDSQRRGLTGARANGVDSVSVSY